MKRILAAVVVAALALPAGLAFGQTAGGARKDETPVKFIDMAELEIRGEPVKPIVQLYNARRRLEFGRLMSLRRSFVPEILKSAEQLALE